MTGGGIDCRAAGPVCQLSLPAAAHVALTAVPDSGNVFAGWTGDCRGTAATSVHVNGPKTCAAIFEPLISASPRTVLYWDSQPGDYIGGGLKTVYNRAQQPMDGEFRQSAATGSRIGVADGVEQLESRLQRPRGPAARRRLLQRGAAERHLRRSTDSPSRGRAAGATISLGGS